MINTRIEMLRFHIQKVLPFVYDDSLSMYELVAKIASKVNEVGENQNIINDNMEECKEAIQEDIRKLYCYLKSQTLVDELRSILDKMVEDGSLSEMIAQYKNGQEISTDIYSSNYNQSINTNELNVDISEMTANNFYELFDSLITENTNRNLSRHIWGSDDFGNQLIYYLWRARKYDDIGNNSSGENLISNMNNRLQKHPNIILTAGVHGNEKTAIYSLYLTIKRYLSGTAEGNYILNNYDLVILPCVTPSGINNNARLNNNGVNINRNFPRNWNDYVGNQGTSNYKGSGPASEKETQFVIDIFNQYFTIPGIQGTTVIDYHTHHYQLHDDKRVLWFTASNYDMRPHMLKYAEWFKDKILLKYPLLKTDPSKNEIFSRFVYVQDPTLINACKDYGYYGSVCEIPDTIYKLDSEQYGKASKDIGFQNVYYYTFYMSKLCDRQIKPIYTSLLDIGCSNDNTLEEVISKLPNDSMLVCRLSSDSTLKSGMPLYNNEPLSGMLMIQKSPTTDSVQATLTFQTVTRNKTLLYINSRDTTGLNGWQIVNKHFYDNNDFPQEYTLQNISSYLNPNEQALLRITSSHPLYFQMPVIANGVLKVERCRNTSGQDTIILLEFQTTSSPLQVYKSMVYNNTVRTWRQETLLDV